MVTSDSIGELAKALAAFQSQVESIAKSKAVQVVSDKGRYNFRYAPLELILDVIKKPLADNGLAITHLCGFEGGKSVIQSRLLHSSGEWAASTAELRAEKNTLQGLGSALTYMRRYNTLGLLGLAADEDDDGKAASNGEAVSAVRKKREETPKTESVFDYVKRLLEAETVLEQLGKAKAAIAGHLAAKRITPQEENELRKLLVQRTADLASKPAEPQPKGKLFDTAEKGAGVGV